MCRKVPITIEQCCNEKIGFSELSGASEAPMGDSVGDSMGDSIPIRPFLNRPLAVIRPPSTTAQLPKNLGISGSLVISLCFCSLFLSLPSLFISVLFYFCTLAI